MAVRGSPFFSSGTTFDSFQIEGNSDWDIDRFTICVTAGRISLAISLITQVLMKSVPEDFEFFNPEIIFSTSSGLTGLRLKEHFLPSITSLNLANGSVVAAGIDS